MNFSPFQAQAFYNRLIDGIQAPEGICITPNECALVVQTIQDADSLKQQVDRNAKVMILAIKAIGGYISFTEQDYKEAVGAIRQENKNGEITMVFVPENQEDLQNYYGLEDAMTNEDGTVWVVIAKSPTGCMVMVDEHDTLNIIHPENAHEFEHTPTMTRKTLEDYDNEGQEKGPKVLRP